VRTGGILYITFIRPLLEYADVIWDTTTQILMNKPENVQVETARIVTGGTRLVSLSNLYIGCHVNMFIPITIVRKL
jgi:hypothetical protein